MKLKKLVALSSIFVLSTSMLVGCNKKEPSNKILNVYNVGDYIDEDLLTQFTEETGIKVQYDTYDTNESMYQKVKGGGTKYDLIFPSDYMVDKMKNENMLEEIDFSKIPNYKYISNDFKNQVYDLENKYSVPYMWGTFGIVYNTKMVKEPVDSWDILWDKKYKGEIQMLDSVRDTMGIALSKLGYSMNTTNPKEINAAKEELIKQKPLVQAYVNDDGKDRLVAGEAAMGIVYSGDAITLMDLNENLAYAVPKEGTNRWIDAMCIPKTAENKDYAEKFINFLLDPKVAKQNIEYIGYSTPNTAALNLLDNDFKENPTFNPSRKVIEKTELFENLKINDLKLYDDAWTELKSK